MSNKSATNPQPSRKDKKDKKDTGSPLVPNLPKDEHEEELIDEAPKKPGCSA
jgi:hypothetical protein